MVAGMERYYQIARCYRDEDFRADRQPEFTQLDIEMSFVEQDDVLAVAEDVLAQVWALVGYDLPRPLPRMTYAEAMARFGTDKPDLRMGQELVECTDYFKETPFRVFQAPYVGAVVMPGGAGQPRKQLDAWQEWAKQRGARGLAYVLVQEDGELGGPVAKNLSDEEQAGLAAHVGAQPGDCVFFAAGLPKPSRALLGAARLEIGRRGGLIDEDAWSFLWVVDAPLFEPADEATAAGDVAVGGGAWTAVHHAFTSPQDLDTFDQDPGDALAWAYDIVCNGNEIGGGSIRIHREDVQKRVFAVMGIDEAEAQEKFGFLLDAFTYGAPPHGGIAFGWDRIVALLARTDSIREVIAFPKSGGGLDPLTAAPAPITAEQRKEAGVDAVPAEDVPDGDRHRLRFLARSRPICYTRAVALAAVPTGLQSARRRATSGRHQVLNNVRPGVVSMSTSMSPDARPGPRLSDEPEPGRRASKRDRRQVADPDRVRPAAPGQDRDHLLRHRHLLHRWSPSSPGRCAACSVSPPRPSRPANGSTWPPGCRSTARPTTASTPTTRSAWRRQTGNDNLAYWIYGLPDLAVPGVHGDGLLHPDRRGPGPGRRLRRRRRRPVISFFTDLFLTFPFLLAALAIAPIITERFGTNIELLRQAHVLDAGRASWWSSAGWGWPG